MTPPPRLQQLLEDLHRELLATRTVDPKSRALMEHLASDLRTMSERSTTEPPAERYGTLRERLLESVKTFEATHPKLSASIEQLIDQLAALNL
jgi:hypothetical protein